MLLPPLASFPSADVRREISQDDWDIYLECWILLVKRNLSLPSKEFDVCVHKNPSTVDFIISYLTASARSNGLFESKLVKERSLRQETFLLTHRILTEVVPVPPRLLQATFLENLSIVYGRQGTLKRLLEVLWDRENLDENSSLQNHKHSMIHLLNSPTLESNQDNDRALLSTVALLQVSFHHGQFLMSGSDYIDALAAAFEKTSPAYQSKLIAIGYLGLKSLLETQRPKSSLLLDHLYSLKSVPESKDFLRRMSSSTPLLQRLREGLVAQDIDRAQLLIQEFALFERTTNRQPRSQTPRKSHKGKSKAHHTALHDMHVHQMSLVTQIQDLFPELGSAFVLKLLEEYQDDTEQVIAHLLEDSLPAHLQQADRSKDLQHPSQSPPEAPVQKHLPHQTRRNVYDDDAFDRLAVPTSSMRQGRPSGPEATLPPRPTSSAKAAILSALAAFDSDSDERDDTYDASDVGGTVDTALPGTSDDIDTDPRAHHNHNHDETLFRAFQAAPETFDRNTSLRRGPARAALRLATGMTDEAIEGWATMLRRDPRRLHRLEATFSISTGAQQLELASSAYRSPAPDNSDAEDTDAADSPHGGGRSGAELGLGLGPGRGRGRGFGPGRGRGQGRGRGGGGGGGGGDVTGAGSSDDRAKTQIARQRKDAHKASRANHNRRDQRARKMARGGGMAG